jgi:arylformamidase
MKSGANWDKGFTVTTAARRHDCDYGRQMSVMSHEPLWRGMTRSQLDAAYNNSAAVANSAEKIAEWRERSASFRAQYSQSLELSYGDRPRNRIDIFPCGRIGAPLFVFFHGGYWQRNDKETFSCLAEGPIAAGFDVALPGYTLAPDVSLTEIVAEVRNAVCVLRREHPNGVASGRLIVGGWSAGGHLTAMAIDLPEVDAGLSISGIFDVEACRLNYLNDKLRLSTEEAFAMSPVYHLPETTGAMTIAYGTAELPELQRQSQDYWRAREQAGLPGALLPLTGHDHFSILEELARPNGALVAALAALASL